MASLYSSNAELGKKNEDLRIYLSALEQKYDSLLANFAKEQQQLQESLAK